MAIRIEAFAFGFFQAIKPQMTQRDRELLNLIFKAHQSLPHASFDELNPAKPAHYFRFGASHLNVLLPVWLLNNRASSKKDRFRVAHTLDHSFILDTKESILYDPTTEVSYSMPEYKPFWLALSWKEESTLRYQSELLKKRLIVSSFSDRLEQLPLLYDSISKYFLQNRLKDKVPELRFGLPLAPDSPERKKAEEAERQQRALIALILEELWQRAKDKAA